MADLREAVRAEIMAMTAQQNGTGDLVLGEFVVIATGFALDSDGETIAQVSVLPYDGSESRILGLLRYAIAQLEHDIATTGSIIAGDLEE